MRSLKPKAFIKATQKTEQYECVICNYIAQKPYICRGPCKQNFCFQCANCIKNNKNQCPFKCSKPFDLQECKEVQLQFSCPFQPQKCEQYIGSIAQFYNHANQCKFVPQGWKDKEQNYRKYRCQKGHDLYFLDEKDLYSLYGYKFYEEPTNSTCSSCAEKGLCRTICPICSKQNQMALFCTNCRKPPCTKKTCLYEHQLVKKTCMNQRGLICDFCGTAAYLLGPNAFRDTECNFDICEVCFINLPDTHELVPFKTPKNVIDHLKHNQMEDSDSEEEEEGIDINYHNQVIEGFEAVNFNIAHQMLEDLQDESDIEQER